MRRSRLFLFVAACLAGAALLGYYTVWLGYDDLRTWQEVEVVFDRGVGGLEVEDPVQLQGVRVGRVAGIAFLGTRTLVDLEIEPALTIHRRGHRVDVVPVSALGNVAVRIDPGDTTSPPIARDARLEGQIHGGLSRGEPKPGHEEVITQNIQELARATALVQRPESGFVGTLLFDRDRRLELEQALAEVDEVWAGIDEDLAQVESGAGGLGAAVASQDAALALQETFRGFGATLGGIRDGLGQAERREGFAGRLLADPAYGEALERLVLEAGRDLRATRRREGFVGGLLAPELHEGLAGDLAAAEAATTAAREGDGLLGALADRAGGDGLRGALRDLPAGLERLRASPLVGSPSGARGARDAVAGLEDFIVNMNRPLEGLRESLPDRQSFQGAVFSIF